MIHKFVRPISRSQKPKEEGLKKQHAGRAGVLRV